MSRGWMLTARWKCFVYALAPKLCQGINCFGELLLAEAKNKPRARLEIQQYWLPSGSAWDCFLALPHCFCRCDLHTEKCTAGVAAHMMGEVLSMSSGSPLSAWGVPAAQHCGSENFLQTPDLWIAQMSAQPSPLQTSLLICTLGRGQECELSCFSEGEVNSGTSLTKTL